MQKITSVLRLFWPESFEAQICLLALISNSSWGRALRQSSVQCRQRSFVTCWKTTSQTENPKDWDWCRLGITHCTVGSEFWNGNLTEGHPWQVLWPHSGYWMQISAVVTGWMVLTFSFQFSLFILENSRFIQLCSFRPLHMELSWGCCTLCPGMSPCKQLVCCKKGSKYCWRSRKTVASKTHSFLEAKYWGEEVKKVTWHVPVPIAQDFLEIWRAVPSSRDLLLWYLF